ncbi:hypothetical protein [Oceanithermus profundus]|uniref:DNA-binding protein n=1 Tax=Oceanithermus profundus (strain DSM 14977 / NBRC 100410 / VKM B-2274 / 506) TaxID=670487 RepID=E4U6K6_OCEP5|nr:hypothetical protein [Oceanithermus profundus]ADR35744.1 hypothetical protein Ocepr_0284 [Oceanithermus profundus DSM 14977]
MIRRIVCALALGLLPALATTYRPVTVADAVQGRVEAGYVKVSGRFLASGAYQGLVRGVVAGARFALPVEGQVFDYRPQPGAFLEVWGELVRGPDGWMLRFHNARPPGEARGPRPVGDPRPGEVLKVWLRVYSAGGVAARTIGRSEDGRSFYLRNYTGGPGVHCLVGRLLEADVFEVTKACADE